MKREPGFYWVELVHWKVATIARWNGIGWVFPSGLSASPRVRKVVSGRLTPPGKDGLPQPLERVLLEVPGKSYREELCILRVNAATGSVYVAPMPPSGKRVKPPAVATDRSRESRSPKG